MGCAHPKDLDTARARHVDRDRSEEGDGAVPSTSLTSRHGLDRPRLAHRYVTSIADIYAHSWCRVLSSSWWWIPKISILDGLGFLAKRGEIRRFGDTTRVARRIGEPEPLLRSFVEVVQGEEMDRGRGRFPRHFGGGSRSWIGGKRSTPEEWME